jgi:hypothetical protein
MTAFLARLVSTRRGRRTLAALLWVSYAAVVALRFVTGRALAVPAGLFFIFLGFVAYTVLTRGLGLTRSPLERPLDERERAERDHAHYVAFQIGNWGMLAAILYTLVAGQFAGLWMPSSPRAGLAALTAVAIAFGILPATVLAWTLPGAEPLEDDGEEAPAPTLGIRTPLPHRKRVAMLAGGVAFGVAAALGALGVVPPLARHVAFLLGVASGMIAGAFVLTRTGDRGRAG